MDKYKLSKLTVDENLRFGFQRMLLFESPVPDGAPEGGSVVRFGRHQVEDGPRRLVTVLASDDGRVQQLGRADAVPLDLWRR